MENIANYSYFLWESEGAHRLLYRVLGEISRRLDKRRGDGLTPHELEENLDLRYLGCVSPPTVGERLIYWRTGTFYKDITYRILRGVKMKLINEKALRGEKLEEHEIAFSFHHGAVTCGESLAEPLKEMLHM